MTSSTPSATAPGQRGYAPLRTVLVWWHVLATVSWLSQAVGLAVLVGISLAAAPGETKRGTAHAAELLDSTVLVFSANAAAGTGLLLAAVTTWGYFHQWWVAIKFVMTIGQLYAGIFVLSMAMPDVVAAAEDGTSGPAGTVVTGALLMAAGLAFQVWLSLAKPFGRTPIARRSRVRPTPAPTWALVAAVTAPVLDIPFGLLIGDPAPALTLLTLGSVLVSRQRRFRAQRREGSVAEGVACRVTLTEVVATGVRRIRLTPSTGETAPWEPGAHVDLVLASGLVRQYSLAGDPADRTAYEVAVLAEPGGRGGSLEVHRLGEGDVVTLKGPRNHFPLVPAERYLLVAGGIGIVPFLPMIAELDRRGAEWRLLYRGSRLPDMAFAEDLVSQHPDRVELLPSDTTPRPDIDAIVAAQPPAAVVYCCGPDSMLDSIEAAGLAHDVHVEIERFDPLELDALPSEPFEVVLAYSRQRVNVPSNTSMLDAVRPVLPDVPASCETGVCGTCVLPLLAGRPDHRDAILSATDRQRTDLIYPCVSRALDERLVVDA